MGFVREVFARIQWFWGMETAKEFMLDNTYIMDGREERDLFE